MLAKLITLKAVGIIGAGVLTVGTAAAATGAWPEPAPPGHSEAASTARNRIDSLHAGASGAEEEPTDTTIEAPDTIPNSTSGGTSDSSSEVTGPPAVEAEQDPDAPEWRVPCPEAEHAPGNHGQFVSSVAKNHEMDEAAGNHGAVVSDAAHSDCGKADHEAQPTEAGEDHEESHEENEVPLPATDANPGKGPFGVGPNQNNGKNPNK